PTGTLEPFFWAFFCLRGKRALFFFTAPTPFRCLLRRCLRLVGPGHARHRCSLFERLPIDLPYPLHHRSFTCRHHRGGRTRENQMEWCRVVRHLSLRA